MNLHKKIKYELSITRKYNNASLMHVAQWGGFLFSFSPNFCDSPNLDSIA